MKKLIVILGVLVVLAIFGLIVIAIGMSFGVDAGYAINPARDFGPRLFAFFEGWGTNAFPGPYGYWWVPVLGPLGGGAVAPFVYEFFVGTTLKVREPAVSPGRTDAV